MRVTLKQYLIGAAIVLGLCLAARPEHSPALDPLDACDGIRCAKPGVVYKYVDEYGRPVSLDQAKAYLDGQDRLARLEQEAREDRRPSAVTSKPIAEPSSHRQPDTGSVREGADDRQVRVHYGNDDTDIQQARSSADEIRPSNGSAASYANPYTGRKRDSYPGTGGIRIEGRGANPDYVQVRGYYRKDGTYVRPHRRSRADKTQANNWSTSGNSNPFTGKKGNRRATR